MDSEMEALFPYLKSVRFLDSEPSHYYTPNLAERKILNQISQ